MSDIIWIWTQHCKRTGETNEVELTDEQKRALEKEPGFFWCEEDTLVQVSE